ncbi:GntR family transcriptional regulator [Cohnella nanjingensis]|uniref:GntR family transcriptional regulator n=1 Tax=Cohnella nanjingensis TaxID=1387779 RepID=A0A7X0VE90_9BACL|nr:GntR family transcriptional regulator [Cohnella nanjingensis]MBB6670750.1 GntR family transcriptional regulator [Cohnella nanjingensis]
MADSVKEPLYRKIMNYLIDIIESGELTEDEQVPTEAELAERFEVSRITSRRALEELRHQGLIYRKRGGGSFVSPKRAASKAAHAAEATDRPEMIALVLPCEATVGKLSDYIQGANNYLENKNYFLTVRDTGMNLEDEKNVIEDLVAKGVKGIIFYPFSDRDNLQLLYDLHMARYPIVTIDKYFESVPISYVVSDNLDGGYQAAGHLLRLGHERIAFICSEGIESATSIRNRYFGYCRALKEAGLPIDPAIVVMGVRRLREEWLRERRIDGGLPKPVMEPHYKQFMKELLRRLIDQRVTAIQTDDDYIAVEAISAALELGIKVPEELSVIGFDNIELSTHIEIPLTTIEQNSYEIGRIAAEIVVKGIEAEAHDCHKIIQPVKLIERASCGKAVVEAMKGGGGPESR